MISGRVRFCVLGSGSKGNAVLVDAGGTLVLIDCGYSAKEIRRRMSDVGCELTQLKALLITHGHGDHVKGARKLSSGMNLLTYATDDTVAFCARRSGLVNHARVTPGVPFKISRTLTVTPFSTPHDEKGSVGYVLDDGHSKLGFCTDLGAPDGDVIAALRDVDALYLEFNHDLQMLQHGPYPAHLKRRVASRYGHLSNDDAARVLRASKTKRLRRVVMAHLSEVNNTPRLALEAAAKAVGDDPIALQVAPQHAPSVWFPVGDPNAPKRQPREDAPSRDVLVDKLSRKTSDEGPAYGVHPSAMAAADVRADIKGGAPGRSTHARAAARARAARLFGETVASHGAAVATTTIEYGPAPMPDASSAAATSAVATNAGAHRGTSKSAGLALRLVTRAKEEEREQAKSVQENAVAASIGDAAPAEASGPSDSPSTDRLPSSKRRRHPMIAVSRQLSLFGGAGDET